MRKPPILQTLAVLKDVVGVVVTGYQRGYMLKGATGDLTGIHLPTVVSWIDVYARATCQPREVVVPLSLEPMGNVVKQLVPSCVTVQRCGGCCPDDGLECVPIGQHQVRMQVPGPVGQTCGWDSDVLGAGSTQGWAGTQEAGDSVFLCTNPLLHPPSLSHSPEHRFS